MQQAINLLDHLDKREALACSATHIAIAAAASFVVMLGISAMLYFSTAEKSHLLASAEAKQQQLQVQLNELRAASTSDNKEVDRLKRLISERREVLGSISRQGNKPDEGFSEHLEGLGRQQITGLWLKHIELGNGGEQISLKGEMRKASLLPRYLQDLGKEPVFSGLRFQLMRIEDVEQSTDQMQFEVTVIPDVEAEEDEA